MPSVIKPEEKTLDLLWQDFSLDKELISLPFEVENAGIQLRSRYSTFVYNMSRSRVGETAVCDIMDLRPGFSYWWMTEISEMQHFSKDSGIFSILRLMLVENFILKNDLPLEEIQIYNVEDKYCLNIIEEYCKRNSIKFSVFSSLAVIPSKNMLRRNLKFRVPLFVRAFAILGKYILERISISVNNKADSSSAKISFWAYFLNFCDPNGQSISYRSQYWTDLVPILEKANRKVRWMHFWLKSDSPGSVSLKGVKNRFKEFAKTTPFHDHILINQQLSLKSIWGSIKDYLRIRTFLKYRNAILFQEHPLGFNYRFAFIEGFEKDMKSGQAMWNCICLNLFEQILSKTPKQELGFYLQENMPWESAFLYAWRKYDHGKIIGVPHATIRFWDLRYFSSYDCFLKGGKPRPDLIAVNSETAKKHLNDFGYPDKEIIIVEALRYLYLNDFYQKEDIRQTHQKTGKPTLLLLGDYDWKNSELLLETISLCDFDLLKNFSITYKNHPGSEKSGQFDFGKYNIGISSENLSSILQKVDLVCTTNSTSSAVEAVTANIPVFSMLNPEVLNMSPLKDLSVVKFFKNYRDLTIGLESFLNFAGTERETIVGEFKYFCIDRQLPRWKRLLDIQEVSSKDNQE